jgi:DNA (cytosine-5)-methyltransferase 1
LTAKEHATIKGVPGHLIDGLSQTNAHQLLGQGIVYDPFKAVGQRIGESLMGAIEEHRASDADDQAGSQVSLRRQRSTG